MSNTSSDRNLVAGVVALQMNFIDRNQFVAAMNAWALDKRQPIEQLLVKQGAIDQATQELLIALVARQLQQHAGDAEKSLAALQTSPDLQSTLHGISDLDVHATLTRSTPPSAIANTCVKVTEERFATPLRYTIRKLHAKGGLGQVSIAEDRELNREVALKEIQERHADEEDCQARFVREAEVTGGLEHPGIVPVYGLGRHHNGRPYYAMRLIRGESFKAAIRQFHESEDDMDASQRSVEFRGLISRFITVCQTLEYAHSRGVVHRDIKPENIMLGKYGETVVVDWGLAKSVGREERHVVDKPDAEASLRVSTANNSTPTLQGTAVGTPAFMSPEQASGEVDKLRPASDIYSLGATLYNIICGRPPFEGKDPTTVMALVQRGEFPAPRALNPQIHRGLEAICLKAMQLKAEDRYASASELAKDLEQWLADEPLTALPETNVNRLSRWTRRNRAAVRTGAVALLFLMTTFIAIGVAAFIERSRIEATNLRTKAEDLAAANFRLAKENARNREVAEALAAANAQLASDERTAKLSAQQLASKNLELAEENAKIADAERRDAQTAAQVADFMAGLFGVPEQDVDFFIPRASGESLTATEILHRGTERLKNDPQLKNFPLAQAGILNRIGNVNRQMGRYAEALPLLEAALEIRQAQLPAEHPTVAESLHNLGVYYHERGEIQKAEQLYRKALDIRHQLPGDDGRRAEASTLQNLAWMLGGDGDAKQAEQLLREVLVLRQQLNKFPHRDVTFTKLGIAMLQIEQQRYLEAIPAIYAVQAEFKTLEGGQNLSSAMTSFGLGISSRETLGLAVSEKYLRDALNKAIAGLNEDNVYVALIRFELGSTLEGQNKTVEAEEQYAKCLKIARDQGQMQHPRVRLLVSNYSELMARTGRAEEGMALWQEFVDAQRKRFRAEHKYVATAETLQAIYLRKRELIDRAIEMLDRVQQLPDMPLEVRAVALNQLGICYYRRKDYDKAEANYRASIVLWKEIVASEPSRADDLYTIQTNLAETLIAKKLYDEAESTLQGARESSKKLGGKAGKESQDFALQMLSLLYREKRQFELALQVIEARRALLVHNATSTVGMARELAECWQLADLAGAERSLLDKLRSQTLAVLKQAQQRGYRNSDALRKNVVFSFLLEDEQFQAILAAMEKG